MKRLKWLARLYFCHAPSSHSQKGKKSSAENVNSSASGTRQETNKQVKQEINWELWGVGGTGELRPNLKRTVSVQSQPFVAPEKYLPGKLSLVCTAPPLWLHLLHSLCEPRVIVQSLMSSVATSYDLFPEILDIWMFVSEISRFLNFIN